jgi:hypothetical protein
MDEVMSGGSYYSQNDFALSFGLGKAEYIDRLAVRWPNGLEQEWTHIPVNRIAQITENSQKIF